MGKRFVKTLAWWGSRGYVFNPTISFVLSNHNMSRQSKEIVNHLRQFLNTEIIVLDDGSEHDHTRALLDHMDGVNEFVVHANDLFDVVMFNRVFGFARGEYIVVLQDDDVYSGRGWVVEAMKILKRDPKIAILGGRHAVTMSRGGGKNVDGKGTFRYAQSVNAAPMWVRRDAFLELGGFDDDFAPNFWHEPELCIRAWLSGYRVGFYRSGVDICAVSTRKRRINKQAIETEARHRNRLLFMEKFGDRLEDVQKMVDACNVQE